MKFWIRNMWISLICWPLRISNKFSIGKVYHMFVRVASYYSYYEQQQHKCDILNADQKSPNHIDLQFEISLKDCLFNFEAQPKCLFIIMGFFLSRKLHQMPCKDEINYCQYFCRKLHKKSWDFFEKYNKISSC